ncbi:hypothetical protein V1505DRAFT_199783 [Lipomyces doorenjongii]
MYQQSQISQIKCPTSSITILQNTCGRRFCFCFILFLFLSLLVSGLTSSHRPSMLQPLPSLGFSLFFFSLSLHPFVCVCSRHFARRRLQ